MPSQEHAVDSTQAKALRQSHGLYAIAVLLFLAGATLFFLAFTDFGLRSLGILACIVSTYFVRKSGLSVRSMSVGVAGKQLEPGTATRPGYLTWTISLILLPVLVVSFLCLYSDARHGYQEAWPVYLFAVTAAVCSLFWSYLAARLL